jgi:DNA-binding XRE family transcriptional regulator
MAGPKSKEARRRARDRAFAEKAEPILAAPESHHRLKVARVAAGVTQRELAKKAVLHRDTISRAESGRCATRNTRLRIAYALQLPMEELFQ